jgi:hypothetical protein
MNEVKHRSDQTFSTLSTNRVTETILVAGEPSDRMLSYATASDRTAYHILSSSILSSHGLHYRGVTSYRITSYSHTTYGISS